MAMTIRMKKRAAEELHENAKKMCKHSKKLLKLIEDMMSNDDDDDDDYNERDDYDDDDMTHRDGDGGSHGGAGRYGRSRYGR